jgi:endogenous inhibitor of DNA gyrase (YacG/DUF329 family)
VTDEAGRASASAKQRKCPVCGKPATKENDPFCSKRCSLVDLNRWLSGAYAIPGKQNPGEDDPEDGN